MDRQFDLVEFLEVVTKNLRGGLAEPSGLDEEKMMRAFYKLARGSHQLEAWYERPYSALVVGYRAFCLMARDRGADERWERAYLNGEFSQRYYDEAARRAVVGSESAFPRLDSDELALVFATREAIASMPSWAVRRMTEPWYMFLTGYRVVWEMLDCVEERTQ